MNTLLIEVTDQKARELLHELEERHLIRVLKESSQSKQQPKHHGKLSAKITGKPQEPVTYSSEWWKDEKFMAELDSRFEAMESGEDKGVTLEELEKSIEKLRLKRYGA